MSKKSIQESQVEQGAPPPPAEDHSMIYNMSNQVARSVVAVIDTLVQRGAFKGEELTTIGGLRDQSIHIIQVVEQHNADEAASS